MSSTRRTLGDGIRTCSRTGTRSINGATSPFQGVHRHNALDAAVAPAYGWLANISDDALRELVALNGGGQ